MCCPFCPHIKMVKGDRNACFLHTKADYEKINNKWKKIFFYNFTKTIRTRKLNSNDG